MLEIEKKYDNVTDVKMVPAIPNTPIKHCLILINSLALCIFSIAIVNVYFKNSQIRLILSLRDFE